MNASDNMSISGSKSQLNTLTQLDMLDESIKQSSLDEKIINEYSVLIQEHRAKNFSQIAPTLKKDVEKHFSFIKHIEAKVYEVYRKNAIDHNESQILQEIYKNYKLRPDIFKAFPEAELKMIEFKQKYNSNLTVLEMMEFVKKGEELYKAINQLSPPIADKENVKCLYWYLTALNATQSEASDLNVGDSLRFRDPQGKITNYIKSCPLSYYRLFTPFSSSVRQKSEKFFDKPEMKYGLDVPGLPGNKRAIIFDQLQDNTSFIKAEEKGASINLMQFILQKIKTLFSYFSSPTPSRNVGETTKELKKAFADLFKKNSSIFKLFLINLNSFLNLQKKVEFITLLSPLGKKKFESIEAQKFDDPEKLRRLIINEFSNDFSKMIKLLSLFDQNEVSEFFVNYINPHQDEYIKKVEKYNMGMIGNEILLPNPLDYIKH